MNIHETNYLKKEPIKHSIISKTKNKKRNVKVKCSSSDKFSFKKHKDQTLDSFKNKRTKVENKTTRFAFEAREYWCENLLSIVFISSVLHWHSFLSIFLFLFLFYFILLQIKCYVIFMERIEEYNLFFSIRTIQFQVGCSQDGANANVHRGSHGYRVFFFCFPVLSGVSRSAPPGDAAAPSEWREAHGDLERLAS